MDVIKTENLKKVYNEGKGNEVRALNSLSLTVGKGEFTAIVGPSGSGKSTLLNIIGGLDKPDSGNVFVDEVDIMALEENERINFRLQNIGFVFQAYNLIPVLNAKENIGFIMLLQHEPQETIDERVEELLRSVGLENQAQKRPNEMSGGQQQRIAVARALASRPKFVLADEPTANLDSKSTSALLDIMEQLNEREGITFIFSTHDQRVIDRARRVVTLEDGKIIEDILQSN
ncbi:ABC transporter ATP-binding protein [Allomuricauda sp. SCSIO 65647]|uniref:ABC transporter ATP-binding protein n=1 Tax=Allomuricauda sp. SCSIO 65647 TaxID=2908843 RepID=UPI001F41AB64|nr:ABC transporter ATP-binding protein [Muricauda sp. SCSIO 65647]UJH66730.1 ABC transporter ATP-binding protein [Muricauda sp. SCSIO 65647]